MLNCPKCGSPRIHRSRSRSAWERIRKGFTNGRIHRCHACNWRGWGPVSSAAARAEGAPDRTRPAPNLQAIDVAIERTRTGDRS